MQQGSSDFLDSNPVVEYAFNVQLDLACPAAQGVRIATPADDALLGVEVDLVHLDLGGTVFDVISYEGVSVTRLHRTSISDTAPAPAPRIAE